MCGIVGIVDLSGEPVDRRTLTRMVDRLRHRGPDGNGVFVAGGVGIGHCRLAITDRSTAAAQPMTMGDEHHALTFAGEIYNYEDLRSELMEAGCRFHSRGDAEVVLNALATWGQEALVRFNGMFALAYLDRTRREILLARDRYGIKPLYHAVVGRTVLFASEIKAILTHPGFGASLNEEALVEYLTFQNFLTERTLFRDVRLLPPGSAMTISLDEDRVQCDAYWDFRFEEPEKKRTTDEYAEELDRLLRRAVDRQIAGETEVGSHLSGGVDSGTITAFASQRIPRMKTFTVGFDTASAPEDEKDVDERRAARQLARLLGTEHREAVVTAGDTEDAMEDIVWHLEEPRMGQSYANHFLARMAGTHCRAVLSGIGGDEIFAGYPWRYERVLHSRDFDDFIERWFSCWRRLLPATGLRDLLAPIGRTAHRVPTRDILRGVFRDTAGEKWNPESCLHQALHFEAKAFMHGLLVVEDKLGMANGMETRVPFLDTDLVDFAQRLPASSKLRDIDSGPEPGILPPGGVRTSRGKMILRGVMERYVPREACQRPKRGFSGPNASWYRFENAAMIRRKLGNPKAEIYGFLDFRTVQDQVDMHLRGAADRNHLIWSLLSLEQWCGTFLP